MCLCAVGKTLMSKIFWKEKSVEDVVTLQATAQATLIVEINYTSRLHRSYAKT